MAEKAEVCWYHGRVSNKEILATHYGRHYCPSCKRCDIVAMCGSCTKDYERHIKADGNYRWNCENCGKTMERRVVGAI